jgi:acyl-CoA synthetase (AMP-forming)/AMP-acid ligase II
MARLGELWRQASSEYADKAYLRLGHNAVSYSQAYKDIGRVARLIQAHGWGTRSSPLAVNIEDPVTLSIVIGACVELDVSLAFMPDCRTAAIMRSMLDETGAKVLLTDSGNFRDCAWAFGAERLEDLVDPADHEPEVNSPKEESGSFIIQTSGTTGDSKSVACGYDQCLAAIEGMDSSGALQHARHQVVYLTPPLSHSYGLSALLEYTYCGSTILFPTGGSSLGPVGELVGKGSHEDVTAIEGVPFFYGQLCRLASRISLPALEHISIGAGALQPEVLDITSQRWTGINYGVRYGLTETPSAVAHKVFPSSRPVNLQSCGRLTGAYDVEIVDGRGCCLPPGSEGEIVVRGDCVATYLGRGRNAELKTGDRGFLDAEGELHVIGRRSAFLKNRGFRISPERVEAIIVTLPGIAEARLIMQEERLVAQVVTNSEVLQGRSLLQQLAARLPAYCVPDKLIQVTNIPRTRSGKVKRN